MRDFASCFSERAVNIKVPDIASCSSSSGQSSAVSIDQSVQVQTAITSLYRAPRKDVQIKITWSKTHMGPVLSVASHILRKRKGTRSYISGNSAFILYWDYSDAKFNSSPEPVSNFYVIVLIDAELALSLGDSACEFVSKRHVTGCSLVSRREQVLGNSVYSTRARFVDTGKDHEIVIKCEEDGTETELVVSVDRKKVVQVGRLRWNFRGNQTIFIDGAPVDVMWDVGGWWFSSPPGHAVFLFRRRSALQSRLWLEEEVMQKEKGISGFSLSIQAFKNSS